MVLAKRSADDSSLTHLRASAVGVDKTNMKHTSTAMDVDAVESDDDFEDAVAWKTFDELVDIDESVANHQRQFTNLVSHVPDTPVIGDSDTSKKTKYSQANCLKMKSKNKGLTSDQVLQGFQDAEDNNWNQEAYGNIIGEPKGGEMYFFDINNVHKYDPDFQSKLLTDGYSWKARANKMLMPGCTIQVKQWDVITNDPVTGKRTGMKDFKKRYYYDLTNKRAAVHYYGDETAVQRRPHGNAKHTEHTHYANSALIEQEIRNNPTAQPTQIYHKMLSQTAPGMCGVLQVPKNVAQIKYQLKKTREELTLDDDVVASAMHVDKYTDKNFVRYITAAPEVSTILMTKEGQDEFNYACKKSNPNTTIVNGYDTTFNYGPEYISWHGYHHPLLERNNPKPGAY